MIFFFILITCVLDIVRRNYFFVIHGSYRVKQCNNLNIKFQPKEFYCLLEAIKLMEPTSSRSVDFTDQPLVPFLVSHGSGT